MIVGPVLFDNINDIFDRAWIANFIWDGGRLARGCCRQQLIGVRTVLVYLLRIFLELIVAGHVDDGECAAERRADVRIRKKAFDHLFGLCQFGIRPFGFRDGIGFRLISFSNTDQKLLVVRRDGDRSWIPARRNETLDETSVDIFDIDDSDTVVICIGNEEGFSIWGNRKCIWSAPLRCFWEKARQDGLRHDSAQAVDNPNAVARCARDEYSTIFWMDGDLIWMDTDPDARHHSHIIWVDNENLATRPIRDIQQPIALA